MSKLEYYADPDNDPVASLERAIAQANKAIYDTSQARRTVAESPQGRTRPIGTTVTCAVILRDRLVLAHVGDSRAYRLQRWQRLILASALAGACLFVALGLATQVTSGQSLTIANNVLEFAGLPALPPTVALLPTSTSTATVPASPTATANATATFTSSPQAARSPIVPPRTRQPDLPGSGMPQPVQSIQVSIPEMPAVFPEPSPMVSSPTHIMPSAISTPTEPPQPTEKPTLPEVSSPPGSGELPALPTVAPTTPPPTQAPPTTPPTQAPTAPLGMPSP